MRFWEVDMAVTIEKIPELELTGWEVRKGEELRIYIYMRFLI